MWCGTSYEMILLINVSVTGLGYCRKCHCRPRNDITAMDRVVDLTLMEQAREEVGGGGGVERFVWALTQPHNPCLLLV